jgi:hypothetical protein
MPRDLLTEIIDRPPVLIKSNWDILFEFIESNWKFLAIVLLLFIATCEIIQFERAYTTHVIFGGH